MKTSHIGLSLAALFGAMGLVEPSPAHARTHASQAAGGTSPAAALQKSRFCNMLLNKEAGSIAHQERFIAAQDRLVEKEVLLSQMVPQNAHQAQVFQKLFNQIGRQINNIQVNLNIGKIRLTNQEQGVNNCLNVLNQINLTNPKLAQQLANFLEQATARAAFQSAEIAVIVNRPAATAFVPF